MTIFVISYAMFLSFFIPMLLNLFFFDEASNFSMIFHFCCQNLVRLFFIFQLVLSSLAVNSRFKLMSKHLERSLKMSKNFSRNFKASNYLKLYHNLCDVIEIINNSLTFPLVLIFVALMVRFVFFLQVHAKNWRSRQILNIFASYDIVKELLKPTESRSAILTMNIFGFMSHFLIKVVVIHVSSLMTEEAEHFTILVCKAVNEEKLESGAGKIDFIFFFTQAKSRNLKLQNDFFVVGWKVLLTVS